MIGILVNGKSGKNRKGKYNPDYLEAILKGEAVARPISSDLAVESALREFRDREVDLLCVSGGDGSMHLTLSQAIEFSRREKWELPLFYPLRAGVMNVVANEVASRMGNPATQCRKLLPVYQRIKAGEPPRIYPQPIMRIQDPRFPRGETYSFTFTGAMLYRGNHAYYSGAKPTPWKAFLTASEIIYGVITKNHWSVQTPEKITADGKPLPFEGVLFNLAATLRKMVLWFSPFAPIDRPLDGDFYAYCCALSPGEIFRHLYAFSRGKRKSEKLFNQTVKELTIEGKDGYTLDGEIYQRKEGYRVRITCGPTIRVLKIE